MITALLIAVLIITSLLLGIVIGWFSREILNVLKRLYLSQKQQLSGVVRNPGPQMIKPISGKGVVRAKSPKEVAMDNERKFREEVGI